MSKKSLKEKSRTKKQEQKAKKEAPEDKIVVQHEEVAHDTHEEAEAVAPEPEPEAQEKPKKAKSKKRKLGESLAGDENIESSNKRSKDAAPEGDHNNSGAVKPLNGAKSAKPGHRFIVFVGRSQ